MNKSVLGALFLHLTACASFPGKFDSAVLNISDLFADQTTTSTVEVDPPSDGGIACYQGDCTDLSEREARKLVQGRDLPGQENMASWILAAANTKGKKLEGFDLWFTTSDQLFAITLAVLWNNEKVVRGDPKSGKFEVAGQEIATTERNYEQQLWATPGASMLLARWIINPDWPWYTQLSAEVWSGIGYGLQVNLLTKKTTLNVSGDFVSGDGQRLRVEVPFGLDTALHSLTFNSHLFLRVGPAMLRCQFVTNGQLGAMTSCSVGGRLRFE